MDVCVLVDELHDLLDAPKTALDAAEHRLEDLSRDQSALDLIFEWRGRWDVMDWMRDGVCYDTVEWIKGWKV